MNVFKPQDRPLAVRSKGQLLSQPMMWEKRPEDPSVSNPMVVDLTADSSREGSSGSSQQLQVVNESMAVEKRPKLQDYLPPVTFANTTITSQQPNMDSATLSPPAAQNTGSGLADPRTEFLSSDRVSPEGFAPQSQNAHSEPHSSYPSLSLPAQPVVDDSEAVRTSLRSKKNLRNSLATLYATLLNELRRRFKIYPQETRCQSRLRHGNPSFVTDLR